MKIANKIIAAVLALSGPVVPAEEVESWVRDETIKFAVPVEWVLVAQQPQPPKAVTAFQIPNAADSGTVESTNVAVSAYDAADADAMTTFDRISKKFREGRSTVEADFEGWKVFRYENDQKGTPYKILDGHRTIGPCVVLVRFAWPQLQNNPPEYDSKMEMAFHALLASLNAKNKLK